MVFRQLLQTARNELPKFIDTVLDHQLENAALYFLAHMYAATDFRKMELAARMDGKRARAGLFRLRAMWHRRRRERFRRLVKAQDKYGQCKGVLSCMER